MSEHERGHLEQDALRESDEVVALKAQLGYLKSKLARLKLENGNKLDANDESQPMIYAVTPTYARPVQKAELTRLCQAFLLVPNLHWILVEDAKVKTAMVTDLLRGCGVSYTQLNVPTPADLKLKQSDQSWLKPKGVLQRNDALFWIREHANSPGRQGVIYFADDDNTYSQELFETVRETAGVSVWPVGLVGGLMVEKPRVSKDGKGVIGWNAVWAPQRPFAVDMAGFAVNLQLFLSRPKAKFAYQVKRGHQESEFLRHLVTLEELEPKSMNRVLVWHTRTEHTKLDMEKKLVLKDMQASDQGMEV
jgi:galactosylgalactosylxylosylprotein 3-beta-glucuronosyltransferase 3